MVKCNSGDKIRAVTAAAVATAEAVVIVVSATVVYDDDDWLNLYDDVSEH